MGKSVKKETRKLLHNVLRDMVSRYALDIDSDRLPTVEVQEQIDLRVAMLLARTLGMCPFCGQGQLDIEDGMCCHCGEPVPVHPILHSPSDPMCNCMLCMFPIDPSTERGKQVKKDIPAIHKTVQELEREGYVVHFVSAHDLRHFTADDKANLRSSLYSVTADCTGIVNELRGKK